MDARFLAHEPVWMIISLRHRRLRKFRFDRIALAGLLRLGLLVLLDFRLFTSFSFGVLLYSLERR